MHQITSKLLTSAGYLIQYACLAHCTFKYLGDFVLCSGPSMEPTIYSDDILLTERISTNFSQCGQICKGNIVIAKNPSNPQQHICKRVKGVAGDRIKTGFNSYEIVPKGHIWLEGDNSGNSCDSRNYGPIPQGLVCSRAICRVWPFDSIKLLIS